MDAEQNQGGGQEVPQAAGDTQQGNAGGQQRFRRRRRRRKNQGGRVEGMQAAASSAEGEGQAASIEEPQHRPDNRQQQNQQGGQGDHRRRRKKKGKKFFGGQPGGQPGNRQTHQPGNNFGGFGNGGGGGRRQKKGRGGRQFVGPMDHSYRAVNGNYAEAPPSTIAVNGNHGRHSRNANMHDTGHQSQFLPAVYEPKPPAIAEDAPTRVYCFIEDLFITAKITESARKLGVKVAFLKGEKDDLARITEAPEADRAHLVLFDLNNVTAKPLAAAPKIRTKLKKTVSIIGYLSHLQGDLKSKAIECGFDSVMPRAAFSQALPNLLRRYGLEDAEQQDAQHAYF